eukprot:UN03558
MGFARIRVTFRCVMGDYEMKNVPDTFDQETLVEVSAFSCQWPRTLTEMSLDRCIIEFPNLNLLNLEKDR